MEGDFFMTKRKKFKTYYLDVVSLKNIAYFIGINYRTCTRWKKLYLKNKLIISHGPKGKKGDKTSTINEQKILKEYLDSAKFLIGKDNKVTPYTFSYFVKYKLKSKCCLSTFVNIMKVNLIASPWAKKGTKKAYNKLLKAKLKNISNQTIKEQINWVCA